MNKDDKQPIYCYLPQPIVDIIDSRETREFIYTEFTGNKPTSQKRVNQVFEAIQYELYIVTSILWNNQQKSKYGYVSFSRDFLHSLFNNRYTVIKDYLKDLVRLEVKSSPTSRETYCNADKDGFTKQYRSNLQLTYKMCDVEKIKFPLDKSEKLRTIFSEDENEKEFKELIDYHQSLLTIDEDAPKEMKKEFNELPENLYKSKLDNRYYGKGSFSSKQLRKYIRYNDEEIEECDIPSAFVHFSIVSCYERNIRHLEEKFRFVCSITEKNLYDQLVDELGIERETVKKQFNSIFNNSITSQYQLNDDQRAIWEIINKDYPIYAKFMLKLNTHEYAKDLLKGIQLKKYKNSKRIAYLVNTKYETNFMRMFIETLVKEFGDFGLLWVHDGLYVPSSMKYKAEEIMAKLFEDTFGYQYK